MLRWLYTLADFARDRARRRAGWDPDHASGRQAEDIAFRYLQRHGLTMVARNFTTPSGSGELDLVGYEGEVLVVVEVKSRTSAEYGPPERNVDREKEFKLLRGAEDFAMRAGVPLERVRFDIVSVVFGPKGPEVRHLKNAFQPKTR